MSARLPAWQAFRFKVSFRESPLDNPSEGAEVELCQGAFSEITGLEATMEPKAIREGGRNMGVHQRVGRTTYATVILKRGMTETRHLWRWFEATASGGYTYRMQVVITLQDHAGNPRLEWTLSRAVPVKIKLGDLGASKNDVAIEELHLAHEGLSERAVGGGPT